MVAGGGLRVAEGGKGGGDAARQRLHERPLRDAVAPLRRERLRGRPSHHHAASASASRASAAAARASAARTASAARDAWRG